MPPTACVLVAVLAMSGLATPTLAEVPSATPATTVEFSVLTPGLGGRFVVYTAYDLTLLGFSSYTDKHRSKVLRTLVERAAYDPCNSLATGIVAGLNEAGRTAVHEPVMRRPAGRIQSLAIGDLPENPQGAVLLDVTINWIGLRAIATSDRFSPAYSLTWRLISPRGELVAPGRELRYGRGLPDDTIGSVKPVATTPASPAPGAPASAARPAEICTFHSMEAIEKDPEILWKCFETAFLEAGSHLAGELPKSPVTARD